MEVWLSNGQRPCHKTATKVRNSARRSKGPGGVVRRAADRKLILLKNIGPRWAMHKIITHFLRFSYTVDASHILKFWSLSSNRFWVSAAVGLELVVSAGVDLKFLVSVGVDLEFLVNLEADLEFGVSVELQYTWNFKSLQQYIDLEFVVIAGVDS